MTDKELWENVAYQMQLDHLMGNLRKDPPKPMTNREWLGTLSNEEFAKWATDKDSFYYLESIDGGKHWKRYGVHKYDPTLEEVLCLKVGSPAEILLKWLEEPREKFNENIIEDVEDKKDEH